MDDRDYRHCIQDLPHEFYGGIETDKVGELGTCRSPKLDRRRHANLAVRIGCLNRANCIALARSNAGSIARSDFVPSEE